MLLNKSIKRSMCENTLIKEKNFSEIIIALNKIARDTGELEYDSICLLESELKIDITFKEVYELRGRYIWVWVTRPYDEKLLLNLERKLTRLNLPLLNYLKIFKNRKLNYVKYPEKVETCRVSKEILEILREQHYLMDNAFEWEKIQNTESWLSAQTQVTREFIADKILKKEIIS
ncbi:hypothetical protein LCGC14_1816570 [marine sediment metagenome]|uniref:Uncharacterized protein n=1 Tax=marine sediment metagenome TaxID=412755 RepID=A0A0F9GK76_9ZZZZ